MSRTRSFPLLLAICVTGGLLALLLSCTDELSGPEPPVIPPGPDTTTHDWRFEVDTLGENYSGAREVIAFSKNDAWACGDFEIERAPGDWIRYPLAHWDGKTWELVMLTVPGIPVPEDGKTIYGFAPDDIWFKGSYLHRYDGTEWKEFPVDYPNLQGLASQFWGRHSNDLYFVGSRGAFGHYDGTEFRKIPTPTDIDLQDIWGDGEKIYMAGTSLNGVRSVLIEYSNGDVILIDTAETAGEFQFESVWYHSKDSILAFAGGGNLGPAVFYHKDSLFQPPFDIRKIPFCYKVRGTGKNNIWYVGGFSYFLHYNGSTWKEYPEVKAFGSARLSSLVVFEDFLMAAGFVELNDGTVRGVVIRGYKN